MEPDQEEDSGNEEDYDFRKIPPLPKYEVVRNLRKIGEVVTYFGETDWERYKRYKLNIVIELFIQHKILELE